MGCESADFPLVISEPIIIQPRLRVKPSAGNYRKLIVKSHMALRRSFPPGFSEREQMKR